MNVKAIIFDLDGTLLDTLRDLAESVNYALRELSLPVHSVDSYRMRVGDGARVMMARSLPSDRQERLDEALALQQGYIREHLVDHTTCYRGVLEMVEQMKQVSLKLAVLSNKPDPLTCKLVDLFFAKGLFDAVRGHRDGTPLKPDPTSALELAEQLDVSPERCVFIGDTGTDIQTGLAAGMEVIGVTWGFRDRRELIDHGCKKIIDHPDQLSPILTA